MKKRPRIKKDESNVYVFYNIPFNFNMFIDANNADEAMKKFDQCGFEHRGQWKIMVELTQQPLDGPDEETNNK